MVRGRFAPSPTGDLHFGSARTALVAWLAARKAGGEFVVRIEDLDRPRAVQGAEERILEDLRWLGLDWDGEVVRQSERTELYEAALAKLDTFRCWCSRAELAASAPHGDEGPRYPGTCRERNEGPRPPSLRLRVAEEDVHWVDRVHGDRCDNPSHQVGDFVVRRADGIFAYQLAVVVDDIAQGITEVVRGDDLMASTARQILLYRALGTEPPAWAHVPLLLGADGTRLSKRHGSIAVRGHERREVIAKLAATLNMDGDDARDLIAQFDYAKLPRTATIY